MNVADATLQEALTRIRELKRELDLLKRADTEGIAVIGCGMRFPGGVSTLRHYADFLSAGKDSFSEVSGSRWLGDDYYSHDPEVPGKMYTKRAGFLDDVAGFDAGFFGISPREALDMDPQQRLLLETVWETLEDAGIAPDKFRGSRTGVYLGLSMDDYMHAATGGWDPEEISIHNTLGNARSVAAGRIAYTFDLTGPCLQLDTACSSSLVAIHLARQALLVGEIDFAIVAGANLILSPYGSIGFSKLKALSPDGICRPFDAGANGYVRGEGVAAVLLQRVADAKAGGARIQGVIRGTAVNHDGKSNGLTAPNGRRQETLMQTALRSARVRPADVVYIEAHGTGTSLGDPIEIIAIGNVYGGSKERSDNLLVGSVKANIGHLEAAAGLASLFKLLVIGSTGRIPPNLNFKLPNPHIPWDNYRIAVPSGVEQLPGTGPWILATSGFGMSGTNAHLLMETAPTIASETSKPSESAHILCLSARDEAALLGLLSDYDLVLAEAGDDADMLANICYTANTGRNHFEWRVGLTGLDGASLRVQIAQALDGRTAGYRAAKQPRLAFWFGDNISAAAIETLANHWPAFRNRLAECKKMLGNSEWNSQQDVIAAQTALSQCLMALGIVPVAVGGTRRGRLTAAVIAGALTAVEAAAVLQGIGGPVAASSTKIPVLGLNGKPACIDAGYFQGDDDSRKLPAIEYPVLVFGNLDSVTAMEGYPNEYPGEDVVWLRFFTASPVSAGLPVSSLSNETLPVSIFRVLYEYGFKLDWTQWYDPRAHRKIAVPTYPFQHKPYWKPLRSRVSRPLPIAHTATISGTLYEVVKQHRLYGTPVVPAALYLSELNAFLCQYARSDWFTLADITFTSPLILKESLSEKIVLECAWQGYTGDIKFHSSKGSLHMKGRIDLNVPAPDQARWEEVVADGVRGTDLYSAQAVRGIQLGPFFHWIEYYRLQGGQVLAKLCTPLELAQGFPWPLHPGLIDSCFHLLRTLLPENSGTLIPFFIKRIYFKQHIEPSQVYRCRAKLQSNDNISDGYIQLYAGRDLVLSIEGMQALEVSAEKLLENSALSKAPMLFDWAWLPWVSDVASTVPQEWHAFGTNRYSPKILEGLAHLGHKVHRPNKVLDILQSGRECRVLWFVDDTELASPPDIAVSQINDGLSMIRQLSEFSPAMLHLHAIISATMASAALESLLRTITTELPFINTTCWQLAPELPDIIQNAVVGRFSGAEDYVNLTVHVDKEGFHTRSLYALSGDSLISSRDWRDTDCLVTGASGALGMALCRRLAEQGARRLVMVSRQSAAAKQALLAFVAAKKLRCEVLSYDADVADPAHIHDLFSSLRNKGVSLGAVFHLAGILNDGAALQYEASSVHDIFAPKAMGAWLLHEATRNMPLDTFVCFSSVSSILPNSGQSIYGAANAFMNALCQMRRESGLPAQSLCWGPWTEMGMAAKLSPATLDVMRQLGIRTLDVEEGFAALEHACKYKSANILILSTEQPSAITRLITKRKLLPSGGISDMIGSAIPTVEEVTRLATQVMRLEDTDLDSENPLETYGLDSLMSMELIERINVVYQARLPITMRIMGFSTGQLTEIIVKKRDGLTVDYKSDASNLLLSCSEPGAAKARLLCLHYLGGDASCFVSWRSCLEEKVDVCTVNWPRDVERPLDLRALAIRIAEELKALPPLPLFIYGHSLGALIGYEVASLLRNSDLQALFVAAMWPPQMHQAMMSSVTQSVEALMHLLYQGTEQVGKLLNHNEWRALAECDLAMMKRYTPNAPTALSCRVVALAGELDPLVQMADMRNWQELSYSHFHFQKMPGNHLFIHEHDDALTFIQSQLVKGYEQTTLYRTHG